MKVTIVHGFGSAGSSRSLRKTASSLGVGSTAAETIRRVQRDNWPVRLDEVSSEELRRSITTMQCCYCKDPRTFKSLSLHWVKGHGITLQDVRDKIGVAKNYSFIDEELRARQSVRGSKFYSPLILRNKGNRRNLTAFGIAANRTKAQKVVEKYGRQWMLERMRQGQQAMAYKHYKDDACVICGTSFRHLLSHPRKTCSRSCDDQRRIIQGSINAAANSFFVKRVRA